MAEAQVSHLFYAYAHRTNNHRESRYLLTFSSVQVCDEWWTLVQSEYPDQAVRPGPQLFSFLGDDFPSKPSTNKKFQHLNTQWFYTQFGDATGTGGRLQDIIPLQDWDGSIKTGGGSGGGGSTQNPDEGKGGETGKETEGTSSIDMSALEENLKNTQAVLEKNNEQISQLTENQVQGQKRLERMEKLIEGNAQQLQALTESHIKTQQQNRELADENAKILRELQKQQTQQQQNSPAPDQGQGQEDADLVQVPIPEPQCGHDVHPPPRKIDKQLVGYAYGQHLPKRGKGVNRARSTGPPLAVQNR